MPWGTSQTSSVHRCVRKHQEGFLEEVMDVIDIGHVTKEGVIPAEGCPLLLPSELSPLDAFVQVSQLRDHRPRKCCVNLGPV